MDYLSKYESIAWLSKDVMLKPMTSPCTTFCLDKIFCGTLQEFPEGMDSIFLYYHGTMDVTHEDVLMREYFNACTRIITRQ